MIWDIIETILTFLLSSGEPIEDETSKKRHLKDYALWATIIGLALIMLLLFWFGLADISSP